MLGIYLLIGVWFPYRGWLLLIILNLSSAIALRTVLTIAHPPAAITMGTRLHCRLLSQTSRVDIPLIADRFTIRSASLQLYGGRPMAPEVSKSGEMTHKVEGSGRIDVHVNAPRGINVKAQSGGMFNQVRVNRQHSMPHADETGAGH